MGPPEILIFDFYTDAGGGKLATRQQGVDHIIHDGISPTTQNLEIREYDYCISTGCNGL
jgi:hypothetical protein